MAVARAQGATLLRFALWSACGSPRGRRKGSIFCEPGDATQDASRSLRI